MERLEKEDVRVTGQNDDSVKFTNDGDTVGAGLVLGPLKLKKNSNRMDRIDRIKKKR
ncbi:MAG: hypothetical protein WCB68_22085 [Pyrinomonadaceae bacterium]